MSPTQRSLKLLRSEGGMVAITERWNPHARVRQDLFGFADLLHVIGDTVIAVQTTTATHMNARIAKIRTLVAYCAWLHLPTRLVEVHGWSKKGPRGKRKVWTCRRVRLMPVPEDDYEIQQLEDV